MFSEVDFVNIFVDPPTQRLIFRRNYRLTASAPHRLAAPTAGTGPAITARPMAPEAARCSIL